MHRIWAYIGFFVLFLSISIITNPPYCLVEVFAHLTAISIITGVFVIIDETIIKLKKKEVENE